MLARIIAAETAAAMRNNPDTNASDWYSKNVQAAIDAVAQLYPEVATDSRIGQHLRCHWHLHHKVSGCLATPILDLPPMSFGVRTEGSRCLVKALHLVRCAVTSV